MICGRQNWKTKGQIKKIIIHLPNNERCASEFLKILQKFLWARKLQHMSHKVTFPTIMEMCKWFSQNHFIFAYDV